MGHKVNNGYKPLACYIFANDKQKAQYVIENLSFGGGCINDVIMHVACDKLPFGGVGESGMGSYHGKKSFDAFTHEKSLIIKKKMDGVPVKGAIDYDKIGLSTDTRLL